MCRPCPARRRRRSTPASGSDAGGRAGRRPDGMSERIIVDSHEVSCGSLAFSTGPAGESVATASTEDRRAQLPLAQIGVTRARRPPSFGRDWMELCFCAAGVHRLGSRGRHENPMRFRGPPPPPAGHNPGWTVRRRACKRACFHADLPRLKRGPSSQFRSASA